MAAPCHLYIAQFDYSGLSEEDQYIEKMPALSDSRYVVPLDGTQVITPPFTAETTVIRLVCNYPINICVDENPSSDQEHMLIPANMAARMRVTPRHALAAVVNADWRPQTVGGE